MSCKTVTRIFDRPELCCNVEEICSRILRICNSRSLKEGICVHSPIVKLSLESNLYLNNNLLSLYAKCFGVGCARHLFDEMPYRDVVSWTGTISAYVKQRKYEEALELFSLMMVSGQNPNEFTLSSVLRTCSALEDFEYVAFIHGYMMKNGFESNPVLGSTLIDFYSKCGKTEEGYKVFSDMKDGDTVSWTTMISSFVEDQNWVQALGLFPRMIESGVPPNEFTFVKLLAASGFIGLKYGKLLHAHLIMWGVNLNVIMKTALVDMYSRFKMMEDAIKISKQTYEYDVFLWTAIISGFAQNLKVREAVASFHEMNISGIMPNNFTYSSILNACSAILSVDLGEQLHSRVLMSGLEGDVYVGNALIHMYMKCSNMIGDALRVFRGIISPNVVSWTSLIAGLAENGFEESSFESFAEMQAAGVQPNSFTLSSILGACSISKSRGQTLKLHGYIIKSKGDYDIAVGNALVDAYAALELVNDAWHVIGMMSRRDIITYTSLATRVNQTGHHEMALNIISHIHNDDIKMDGYSLACFLSAAAGIGTMETGRQLHCYSVKSGLGTWISVSNGLVDLYGKCGYIHDVQRAFGEIVKPDIVSWNGLISGLSLNGYISSALSAFDELRLAGVKPNSVTFLVVLLTCCRGGLVDMGLEYFQSMREFHDIVPQLDHYVCLVDLLGRAGQLESAIGVIETMPFKADALIYKTLLGACKLHRNVPLGEDMARRGLELDPLDPAIYVLLASIYYDSGLPGLGEKTRMMMAERGLRKNIGQCWMEMRNKVHSFMDADSSHPKTNEIHERIKSLICELKNRFVYEGNGDSSYHSEKLAVAFGLFSAPPKAPIRIIKKIRMCKDCHDFIMLVTQLYDREIIVKEGARVHTFKKGRCSCQGCW